MEQLESVARLCSLRSLRLPLIACLWSRDLTMPTTAVTSLSVSRQRTKSVCRSVTSPFLTSQQIGVTLLPVDGNVHRHMATIAHPEPISSLVSSFDGHFLFSSGEASAGIHVWQVNPSSLFAASRLGGDGLEPFLNMLEGGKTGEFLHQLEDYFYFAQIRAQGEDSMEKRVVCSASKARR